MPQSIQHYIRTQEIGPVVGNVLINPFLAWLGNRDMEGITLLGDHSIVIDTALTSIIASLLVTLFAAWGVHRDLKAKRIEVPQNVPQGKSPLLHLPRNSWTLGLLLGLGIAAVLVPLLIFVFHLFDIKEISFRSFLVVKAVYTGLLGLLVARWVIIRQLAPNRRIRALME